jgi:hypothetical protein
MPPQAGETIGEDGQAGRQFLVEGAIGKTGLAR